MGSPLKSPFDTKVVAESNSNILWQAHRAREVHPRSVNAISSYRASNPATKYTLSELRHRETRFAFFHLLVN